MKKSEMRKILRDTNQIETMLLDMERRGMTWDPEEEPLPDYVAVNTTGEYLMTSDKGQFWAQFGTPGFDAIPMRDRKRIAAEAVRRYNAVTAALESVKGVTIGGRSLEIIQILRSE